MPNEYSSLRHEGSSSAMGGCKAKGLTQCAVSYELSELPACIASHGGREYTLGVLCSPQPLQPRDALTRPVHHKSRTGKEAGTAWHE